LLTVSRKADLFDVIANLTGAILSVFVVIICSKLKILNLILKN
jgi:hypothetical protein